MEKDVPYIAFESEMTKAEMRDKRKDRIIALLAIIILISNMAWLWVFNQYDFSTTTTEITTDEGNTNLLEAGNNGEINNGINSKDDNEDGN